METLLRRTDEAAAVTTARFRSPERNAHRRGRDRPHRGAGAAGGIPADATIRTSRLRHRLSCGRIVVARREIVVRLNEGALFFMPFGDAYWSRLLGTMTTEIEALLRAARQDRYTFVDCGANFGYWSVLASSRSFGAQQSRSRHLAPTCSISIATQKLNGNCFRCLHAAVGGRSGGFVRVTGASR